MLKTIKTTKQLKLDELIKYCRDNNIKNKSFYTVNKEDVGLNGHGKLVQVPKEVKFDNNGHMVLWGYLALEESFEVEVVEEITEEKEFELLVEIYKDGKKYLSFTHYNFRLNQVIDSYTDSVYALIGDKLELIWEADHD